MKKQKRLLMKRRRKAYERRQRLKRAKEAAWAEDVLPPDEAEANEPWNGCSIVFGLIVTFMAFGAVIAWISR